MPTKINNRQEFDAEAEKLQFWYLEFELREKLRIELKNFLKKKMKKGNKLKNIVSSLKGCN